MTGSSSVAKAGVDLVKYVEDAGVQEVVVYTTCNTSAQELCLEEGTQTILGLATLASAAPLATDLESPS